MSCPFDYYLRKVLGFSPTIKSEFGYGLQVHKILKMIHEEYEGDITTLLPTPAEAEVIAQRSFRLRYARGTVFENLRNFAVGTIVAYVRTKRESFPYIYRAEVPFEMTIGNAMVSGSIDLIEKIDPATRESLEVEVIDFKTERDPGDDFNPRFRDALFQVRLYSIASRDVLGLHSRGARIYYLQDGSERRADVSVHNLGIVERSIEQNVNRILERNFARTPTPDKCRNCDSRLLCPQTPGR